MKGTKTVTVTGSKRAPYNCIDYTDDADGFELMLKDLGSTGEGSQEFFTKNSVALRRLLGKVNEYRHWHTTNRQAEQGKVAADKITVRFGQNLGTKGKGELGFPKAVVESAKKLVKTGLNSSQTAAFAALGIKVDPKDWVSIASGIVAHSKANKLW